MTMMFTNRSWARWLLFSLLTLSLAASAEDLYQMTWRGLAYSTNANGTVRVRAFNEQEFVRQVAADYGLNAKDLVFVYRADKRDTAVVRKDTGAFVANIIQMEFVFTDVSNRTGTFTVRQALLFDEYQEPALGSAFGTERVTWGKSQNRLLYSFYGTFMYSKLDNNTIYRGNFATIRKVIDRTGG